MVARNGKALLDAKLAEGKYVCVGLDTENKKVPHCILPGYDKIVRIGHRMRDFNTAIIQTTKDLVCAYKYNVGFYLAEGFPGLLALQESVAIAKEIAPDVITIGDGKFGDIGISSKKWAQFAFEVIGFDAVTVNPLGGYEDCLDAFFMYEDKMIFVWCEGSNKGAMDFQAIICKIVARDAVYFWNKHNNCGLVIGATYPDELKQVRKVVGEETPILVPGIGAQGGDLEAAVKAAGPRTLFTSSRGIIYASSGPDFAEAARKEVITIQSRITEITEAMKR